MPYLSASWTHRRVFLSFALLATIPAISAANGYLQAGGSVGALVGGPTDGYNQVKSPSFLGDVASGHDYATLTAGGYYTGFADIFGESMSSSTTAFGHITESSSATSRGYTAYSTGGYGGSAGYASEVITIHGSGTVAVTLHSRLIGNTLATSTNNVIDGAGSRVRSQTSLGPSGYVDHSQEIELDYDYSTGSVFNSVLSQTVYVTPGSELRISGGIQESSGVQLLNSTYDVQALRTVTAFNEGNLNYWISLSPGGSLSSESGYLYEAPAAVPEPTSLAALGLGAVALLRRGKKGDCKKRS